MSRTKNIGQHIYKKPTIIAIVRLVSKHERALLNLSKTRLFMRPIKRENETDLFLIKNNYCFLSGHCILNLLSISKFLNQQMLEDIVLLLDGTEQLNQFKQIKVLHNLEKIDPINLEIVAFVFMLILFRETSITTLPMTQKHIFFKKEEKLLLPSLDL
ncbi:hypothetical protein ACJX0J_040180 [Zea mays]